MQILTAIPSVVRACASAVSRESSRYALTGVDVRVESDGKSTWSGTDGKSLITVDVNAQKLPEGAENPGWTKTAPNSGTTAILDAKALLKACKAHEQKRGPDPVVVLAAPIDAPENCTGVGTCAYATVGGHAGSIRVDGIEGSFPNVQDVFPGDNAFTLCVDAGLYILLRAKSRLDGLNTAKSYGRRSRLGRRDIIGSPFRHSASIGSVEPMIPIFENSQI